MVETRTGWNWRRNNRLSGKEILNLKKIFYFFIKKMFYFKILTKKHFVQCYFLIKNFLFNILLKMNQTTEKITCCIQKTVKNN